MAKTLRNLLPHLSRRAWIVIGCQWLAIFAVLWFAITIKPSVTLHSDQAVVPIGFTDDGQSLITFDYDVGPDPEIPLAGTAHGPVRTWDLTSRVQTAAVPLDWSGPVDEVVLAPGGTCVALQMEHGGAPMVIHSVRDARRLWRGRPNRHLSVFECFSSNGKWFLAELADPEDGLRAIALEDGREWRMKFAEDETCYDVALAPDETSVVLLRSKYDRANPSVERWELGGRLLWSASASGEAVAFSHDGRLLAVGHDTGGDLVNTPDGRSRFEPSNSEVRLLDADSGQVVREFAMPNFRVDEFRFNRTNTRLTAVQHWRGFNAEALDAAVTWDLASGQLIYVIRNVGNQLKLHDVVSDERMRSLRGEKAYVHYDDDNPDQSQRRSVIIRLEDGREVLNGWVACMSPDGRYALRVQHPSFTPGTGVMASLRSVAERLGLEWRDRTYSTVRDLEGWGRTVVLPLDTPVTKFSPDGRRLVSQCADGKTLHVWDLPARPTVGQLLAWSAGPCAAAFLLTWGWCVWRRRRVG